MKINKKVLYNLGFVLCILSWGSAFPIALLTKVLGFDLLTFYILSWTLFCCLMFSGIGLIALVAKKVQA